MAKAKARARVEVHAHFHVDIDAENGATRQDILTDADQFVAGMLADATNLQIDYAIIEHKNLAFEE